MPRGVSRYDEARLQGRLWTPHLIAATSIIVPRINAGTVQASVDGPVLRIDRLRNLAFGGVDFLQTSGALRPALASSAYIDITGNLHLLQATYTPPSPPFTIFVRFTARSTQANGRQLIGIGNNTTGRYGIYLAANGTDFGVETAGGYGFTGGFSISASAWNSVAFVTPSTNIAAMLQYRYGVLQTTSGSGTFAFPNGELKIGGLPTLPGYAWDGLISHVVILPFSATRSQVQALDGWAAWNDAAPQSLPAAHPYRTNAPLIGN
jgi:hypothetical protein